VTTRLTVETYIPPTEARTATMPWWVAAAGGAVIAAVAGWIVITALVMTAQVGATGQVAAAGLRLSTQVWLLAHGGVLQMGGTTITLVPLGFTVLIALVLHGVGAYAGKQAALQRGAELRPVVAVWQITGVVTLAYGLVAVVAALVLGGWPVGAAPVPNLRAGAGAAGLAAVMGFAGAARTVGVHLTRSWPEWARAIPRAIGVGVLIAALGGTGALVAGLVTHKAQFIALTTGLNAGTVGSIVLALLQLGFVVNLIWWCVAWCFGPGFTVGDGSVVSLMGSQVGLLPAFPVTAGLPTGVATWWTLAWLLVPLAAGAGAAVVILRARAKARFDATALVGGLSGVLAGVVVAAIAGLTRGSLGADRLAGLGPFVGPLLIIAPSLMGIGGVLTGFVVGLVRRPDRPAGGKDSGQEVTQKLPARRGPDEQPALDFYPAGTTD